jgi:hypothetical protein
MATDQQVSNLSSLTNVASGDELVAVDSSSGSTKKVTLSDLQDDIDHDALTNYAADQHRVWENSIAQNIHDNNITASSITQHQGSIDHNQLTNYVSDEHVKHSNINANPGVGLSGGGDISTDFTFDLDVDSLTEESSIESGDFVPIHDADSGTVKKADISNISGQAVSLDLGNDGNEESADVSEIATTNDTNAIFTESSADTLLMDASKNWPTADEVNISALTNLGSSVSGSDEVAVADVSDANNIKKVTAQDIADLSGSGGSAITLDLGDDGTNESTDLTEIATSGDANNIVTEPAADKALFDFSQNYPTADSVAGLSGNNVESVDNVASATESAGQVLIWHGTNGQYENASITGGSNTTVTEGDASITIDSTDTQLSNEEVQDSVYNNVLTGAQTLINVTYDDANNQVDYVVDNDLSNYDNSTSSFTTPSSTDTLTNKTIDADGIGNNISNIGFDETKTGEGIEGDGADGIQAKEQVTLGGGHFVNYADALSNEPVDRIVLQTGETLVVERIEFRKKDGTNTTSASVRVQDTTAATTIGSQNASGTTKDPGSSGTGNTVEVQISNSTGAAVNASVKVTARVTGA